MKFSLATALAVLKWIPGYEYLKDTLYYTLGPTAHRVLVSMVMLLIFVSWGGIHDGQSSVYGVSYQLSVLKRAKIMGAHVDITVEMVWNVFWAAKRPILKLFFSGVFSMAVCRTLLDIIQFERGKAPASNVSNLTMLLQATGIVKIYPSQPKMQPVDQDYASEMREAVTASKKVKIMMIAGYEYFGKGQDALLFDTLKKGKNKHIEFVLLDTVNGGRVVRERVEELIPRDAQYSEDKLKKEVQTTCDALKSLKSTHKGKVELYVCRHLPVFRLVILDKCLFFNTYARGVHGHESPVYLLKKPRNAEGNGALYESFDRLYELYKEISRVEALT